MAKAIVVAAPASGSGKTLITLGLLRAFRNGGVRVAAAKVGPDYIDPRFHEAATGRPCYNLDPWAMSPSQIKGLVAELVRDTDLLIIEGVMGLFDGEPSAADLAQRFGLPVLAVIHTSGSAAVRAGRFCCSCFTSSASAAVSRSPLPTRACRRAMVARRRAGSTGFSR